MRRWALVLTLAAAVAFLIGTLIAFFGYSSMPISFLVKSSETYWRGATGLLGFAIVLLLLERSSPKP